MKRMGLYAGQLLLLLAILAWLPGNAPKLMALVVLWLATFGRLSAAEWAVYGVACVFFSGMNAVSLHQGIFAFGAPDVLGMPVYELFMWGFYLLHTWRMLDGPAPQATTGQRFEAWSLALLYALAFSLLADANTLFAVTGVLLLLGLARFHAPLDLAYTGYMVLLGAAVEYTGVFSGQWSYPGHPPGGVPLWFITLWGGVGLLLRRLVVPWLRMGAAGSA